MKLIIIILFAIPSIIAQSFTVEKISGETVYRANGDEEWSNLKVGDVISDNATISTGEKSNLQISNGRIDFRLGELSAVSVSNIKEMSVDDFLLALALEDVLNAPPDTNKYSDNTAVYGTRESEVNSIHIKSDDFGIKRLNGAVQLAELGYEESAVVSARETFRKYPATKTLTSYRIFFADILLEKSLYEEALTEYSSISKLQMNDIQKAEVDNKMEIIRKKMLGN